MNFEESLIKNYIKLPEPKAPVGSYVATKIAGKLLYISGQISIDENGASDLIALIFGEDGMHTRAAVSTNSLPLGVSVEVDAIFELN